MAGASVTSTRKGGIKSYWKHRGCDRLDAVAAQRRPPLATAQLGAGGGAPASRPLGWRLLRALSPRRWLARRRDGYVNAMLWLGSSTAVGYGAAPFCAGAEPFARPRQFKVYDEKVLVEMYRSILARGGVIPLSGDALVVGAAPLPATMVA